MRPARAIIPVIPSALTLSNLACGFVAMAKTVDAMTGSTGQGPLDPHFAGKMVDAAYFVLLAMIFDMLDGRIARLTNQASPFGALLDSLSDIVSFGVAPALMAKAMYEHAKTGLDQPFFPKIVTALCLVYVVCAALRLARFTVGAGTDDASHHTFQGLPSPAAAGLIATASLFIFEARGDVGLSPAAADGFAIFLLRSLPALACGLGLLMVSRVPYVHLVQRYVGQSTRVPTFVKMVLIVSFVLLFHEWSLFVVSWVYVLGGMLLAARARITGRPVVESLPEPWADDEPAADDPAARGGSSPRPGNGKQVRR